MTRKRVERDVAWRHMVSLRDGWDGLGEIAGYIMMLEEDLAEAQQKLAEVEREFNYYKAGVGWKAIPGEYSGESVDLPEHMAHVLEMTRENKSKRQKLWKRVTGKDGSQTTRPLPLP
jgi:hypothetical protein